MYSKEHDYQHCEQVARYPSNSLMSIRDASLMHMHACMYS